jgi:hypothetical protein
MSKFITLKIIPLLLLLSASAFAQFGSHDVLYVGTAPSGACTAGSRMQVLVVGAGTVYACQNITGSTGTWTALGSSGATGTVTAITAGAGLDAGGTPGATISLSGTLNIHAASVTNAMLANPSITITASGPLSGGGNVALGSSVSIGLGTLTAGSNGLGPLATSSGLTGILYGNNTSAPTVTTAAQLGTLFSTYIAGLTGCTTASYVYVPATPNCVAQSGGGGGLISFTSGNLSPLFTTSLGGSPTTAPALAFTATAAGANTVLGNPSGTSGAYSFTANPVLTTVTANTSMTIGTVSGTPCGTSSGACDVMGEGSVAGTVGGSGLDVIVWNGLNNQASVNGGSTYNILALYPATGTQINTFVQGLTNCTTTGYVYSPPASDCISVSSGSGTVNSGTINQMATYLSSGTAVSGDTLFSDNLSTQTLAYSGTGGMTIGGSGAGLIAFNAGAESCVAAQPANTVCLESPATVATAYHMILPAAVGTVNQVLAIASVTGQAITLGFATAGGGTPCTTTALSLQYNNAGAFGCVTPFTFASSTISGASSAIFDMSGATGAAALKFPAVVGGTALAGTVTANLSTPIVLQNTNSSNNNTSITLGVTSPGTSSGQTTLNVNGAATGGDLVDFGTGGTWASGVLSGQTILAKVGINGAFTGLNFTSNGTTAGFFDLPQGSTSSAVAPCNTATSICFQAPTSVTSQLRTFAGTPATGFTLWTNTAGSMVETLSATSTTLTSGVGTWGNSAINTVLASTVANVAGHFTNLQVVTALGGGTCTTSPQFNVFDGTTNTGSTVTAGTSTQTKGTGTSTAQTQTFAAGDIIGIYISTAGGTCTTEQFTVTAQYSVP